MRKRIWIVGLLLVGIGGGWFYWNNHRTHPEGTATPQAGGGGRGRGPGGFGGPVPVLVAEVGKQDVPIFLDGLGTVQAFNSVTVRSRVDGQLEKIAFTEGDDVKAGDLLAVIDQRPFQAQLAQAEAKKRQDEAQLQNAQAILTRNSELLKKGVVDRQSFDTSKFQLDQLQAAVQSDEAAIENAQTQLSYTRITSPIDGRVGVRQVDQGNIIHANDQNGLVVITQLRPISVVFTLPEQNLQSIFDQGEEPDKMKVLVVDRGNTKTLAEGTLAVIDNQIDPGTATVRLKATFANENLRLWPGQFVNARLLLTVHKDGTVVPSNAVQRGPNGTYVYVINADKTAEMRPIKVVQTDSNLALIETGVKPGEQVVVDGQYKLQPGAQVQIAGAPQSQDGKAPPQRGGGRGRGPASGNQNAQASAQNTLK